MNQQLIKKALSIILKQIDQLNLINIRMINNIMDLQLLTMKAEAKQTL